MLPQKPYQNFPGKLSERIGQTVHRVNTIRKFPLSDSDIEDWAHEIVTLMPREDLRKVGFVVDSFINGDLPFDPDKGVRNIFEAVKIVKEVGPGEFEILKPIWG